MEQKVCNSIVSYLSFYLGNEVFAIHVSKVFKILEMIEVTQIPKAPDYMRGVINLRGEVLPVIDTRIKFGMSPVEKTKTTCILVVEVEIEEEEAMVGLLVDDVQAVLKMENENILPPPSMGKKFKSDFIEGMAKKDEKFVMILNLDTMLTSDALINLKDIESMQKQVKLTDDETDETGIEP
jgi:purine-binding chemotaxis protein CheW